MLVFLADQSFYSCRDDTDSIWDGTVVSQIGNSQDSTKVKWPDGFYKTELQESVFVRFCHNYIPIENSVK